MKTYDKFEAPMTAKIIGETVKRLTINRLKREVLLSYAKKVFPKTLSDELEVILNFVTPKVKEYELRNYFYCLKNDSPTLYAKAIANVFLTTYL